MTLVYALANDAIGFLVADTLLVPALQVNGNPVGPVNIEFLSLKIHILSPGLAVAFATNDDAEECLRLVQDLQNEINTRAEFDTSRWIFERYWASRGPPDAKQHDSEFLVLTLTTAGKKLEKITRDGVLAGERFYIGDGSQYAALRASMQGVDAVDTSTQLGGASGEAEFEAVSTALEALVGRSHNTVGGISGLITRVVDARISGELEYLQSGEVSVSPWEGASGFTALASNAGARGMGIYFRSGGIGYVLPSANVDFCRVLKAGTIAAFVEQAREAFGMQLEGPTW